MRFIYCTNIKQHILQSLKCAVFVHIVDETLIVDITHSGTRPFRYTKPNIYALISAGISSEQIATEILKKYRAFILNEFFIKTY